MGLGSRPVGADQSQLLSSSALIALYKPNPTQPPYSPPPRASHPTRHRYCEPATYSPPLLQRFSIIILEVSARHNSHHVFVQMKNKFARRKSMLLIAYSEEIVDGEPINVSSNCLPIKASKLEPAGHAFHAAALRLIGHSVEAADPDADIEKEVSNEKEHVYVQSSDSYSSSKGKKKPGGETKQQDHYALLGLSHLRYLATEDQIKKSYREAALRHHPDKQASLLLAEETESGKQAKKDEIENHFKAIQESYEVLIDPVRRRIYDSTDEFDDEIPSDCAPQDFFKVFGPAFLRNGRWSVGQPIPTLGDDKTTLKEVDNFYDFWYSFKSWREFPHTDEFDLEQAESRDHRRWMERQNAKLSEKARKEEYARIRTLVDNAYKRDPRILRRKEEVKAEKQRKKEAKVLAKKLEEEAVARIAEEERHRKEEEEKRAAEAASNQKKLREREKKLLRKERTRLRTLSSPILAQHLLDLTDDDVEGLCSSLDKEQLRNLCDDMEGKEVVERAEILRKTLELGLKLKDVKEDEKNFKQQNGSVAKKGQVAYSNEKKEKPWSKEEIELLRKGMLKYPKGTSRRWEVISEFIGTKRSVEEILKATKTVLLQKPDSAKAFDSFLEKRKPAQTIASPLSTREDVKSSIPSSNAGLDSDNLPESSNPSGNSSNLNLDNAAADVIASSSDEDSWSVAQERVFVQALKSFPKEKTSQRWERVAAAVPGKTVGQCKKKFALMRDSFRNSNVADKNITNHDDLQELSAQNEKSKSSVNTETENGILSSSELEDIWSEVQEKELIQALKTFPRDTNQRWEHVAAAVRGKTINQCKKKFASLKENFRNKKTAVESNCDQD
ncbi:Dnaj homolog subfamily c member 2 [Phtheirospermum japonicum]|uniref:Dnaj homolog subfamily c member 2 n=1 Tax=Phtheirospermum japonicum TaxID=374723 RepID=A0A830CUV2_9LAMI|nr:Dnaj homolog subfamily c member 2 [Phtheirospermum japonicum]